jgi:hypothetical protein
MKLTRAQLAKFLPDNESIRIFEEIATTADRADLSAGQLIPLAAAVSAPDTTVVSSGLSAALLANTAYRFEFFGAYTVASAAIGTRWVVNGPAASVLAYKSEYALTATATTINNLEAYNLPAAANASSSATGGNIVKIEGIVKPAASGMLTIQFASGGVSAVNLVAGHLRITRLT